MGNGATVEGAKVSIGATLVEGTTLEIVEWRTTMPLSRYPVAIVLIQLELRSSDGRWPVPRSPFPMENTQH